LIGTAEAVPFPNLRTLSPKAISFFKTIRVGLESDGLHKTMDESTFRLSMSAKAKGQKPRAKS
jgi:hypothetical protein